MPEGRLVRFPPLCMHASLRQTRKQARLCLLPCRICLVASCPGGTASNVVTFLANADVALSVMMTTVSTFAAVIMTPLLTKTLVGAMVPVDAKALFMSTLQVEQDMHTKCTPLTPLLPAEV